MKYSKFITFEQILISLVVIIATTLLVWNRVDTETHLPAINLESREHVERGEIMTTFDEYVAFEIDNSTVYLSKNTELKLIDGREGQIDLQLIQGRIVLTGNANVSIREVNINTNGMTSIVHYSWLDQIEVATIDADAFIEYNTITYEQQLVTLSNQAIRMETVERYNLEYIQFSPSESSEADFYDWVANK